MVISYQWACDLVSEFVYQFQGFCQYRTLINNKNEDEISILENNPDLWSVGIVFRILNDLVRVAKLNNSKQGGIESNRIHEVLGYFAIIELARLECLLADYHSSLKWSAMVVPYLQGASSSANQGQASSLINGVPVALYNTIPICHINVYYHAGVSLLMMHRYTDAMRIFNEIIMHISQRLLKQGNIIGNRPGTQLQLQRMLDRILALTGLCVVLYPCVYSSAASSSSTDTQRHHGNGVQVISDQAKEMIEAHLGDKYRQLQNGDALIFENIFENSTPKFISAALPNYHVKDEDENYVCHDAIKTQLHVFGSRIRQELSTLKLKSYLKLYTSIGIDKLSRYDGDNSSSEDSMVSKLLSMKHKTAEVQASAGFSNVPNVSILDVNYHIDGNVLVIDNANAHKAAKNGRKQLPNMQFYENVFSSTIRSNQALAVDIEKSFEKHGL